MSVPTTSIFLNKTTPAAPSGQQNVVFASDGATPQQSISASDPVMVGDTGSGGKAGNVPAPAAGDAAANKFLRADGLWTSLLAAAPLTLPAANGGSSYTLPSVVSDPTASFYFVRRLKWQYSVDYTITTASGVSTLNILSTAIAPQTGDIHELYAQ